ncbi:ribose-phosphate diphosphokinase family member [Holotrichia oblita]|nr:ribose-phosphate diphosphokinase family member [Holotrichia oblita]
MCEKDPEASDAFESGEIGSSEVKTFDDGEISLKINETVRGADVYIIQPTCAPVNNNLMELLIMIDATRRASAGRITAVIPYFGYARQDRKMRARDPISAKLVADIITTAGADRVLTMDLHCDQIQGFFDIPVDHLRGMPLFYEYYEKKFPDKSDVVIVSPDLGSVARARMLAEKMNVPLAIVDKRRPAPNQSEVMNIIGNVKNKTAIILDDMIDTAGSLTNAANAIKDYGANEVYACATHALFSGKATELVNNSAIKELVILDTIPLPCEKKLDKIKIITVAPIFAAAIFRTHCCMPVSRLFE